MPEQGRCRDAGFPGDVPRTRRPWPAILRLALLVSFETAVLMVGLAMVLSLPFALAALVPHLRVRVA
ncbi:hypothetical protein AA309_30785 [Microvirga vignae]|uniref:Uncharacterized protein n=1 Tax=Microvirga vignae TaxID=1225564 RepID=A0A0H1RAC7_9HYPH|nr:hypothetical protein AA309_30785 [Microvirga vignae]